MYTFNNYLIASYELKLAISHVQQLELEPDLAEELVLELELASIIPKSDTRKCATFLATTTTKQRKSP